MGTLPLIAGAVAVSAVLLSALYLWQLRTRDAGIVDVGWSGGLGLMALGYALLAEGQIAYRIALAAVACFWSFRLAYYIFTDRVLRGGEDKRYAQLREGWGAAAPRKFALVFAMNAVLVVLFSLPFLMVAQHPGPFGVPAFLGVLVGFGAIAGESLADRQLRRWKANPENQGKTCRGGLWRYSRHPNYFFEWVHWWAYVLLAWGTFGQPGWPVAVACIGPIVMYLFLNRVTGIPHAERQSIKSRGEDYRAYQRETSAFFPWFPREPESAE